MTRLPWRKNINKEKKRKQSNFQVKLNQVVMETKPRRRIHGDWYWLALDTLSHSFTTTTKKQNLLGLLPEPWPSLFRVDSRWKLYLTFFGGGGLHEGAAWGERTLGKGGSLCKLEDCGLWKCHYCQRHKVVHERTWLPARWSYVTHKN